MTGAQLSEACFIGDSAAAQSIRSEVEMAARWDMRVLITGETGAGKDVVARLIHQTSPRRPWPMASLNCAGLSDSLIASELFGHERGSFTDAHRDRAGVFETASKGTVFLDEVGEMSPRMQGSLLRFLETGEIQRVGSDRPTRTVDVRVIAATNRDLLADVESGRFREDLYYRLNVLRIHVPPLRERRDDIPLLVCHYVDRYTAHHRLPSRPITRAALDRLTACDWPGNVRQLKNVVERTVLRCKGTTIDIDDLPTDVKGVPAASLPAAPMPAGETPSAISAEQELLSRMIDAGESFWSAVFEPFDRRDLTRAELRAVVSRGLELTSGSYRQVVRLFNMPDADYKRFLRTLRAHGCHFPPQTFRNPPHTFHRPHAA
jgi:two-component system, NtrC family, response regulator HydG